VWPVPMRLGLLALIWIGVVSCTACDSGGGPASHGSRGKSLAGFGDGAWDLRVDRAWDGQSGSAGSPSDQLADNAYQRVTGGGTYRVIVSDHASAVSIGPTSVRGQRTTSAGTCLVFSLSEGAFAGGRFVVWEGSEGLQAEVTLYGSGRPIVESERGALVPAP
jgi:hypothetical protein